jgi:hypothetical protein
MIIRVIASHGRGRGISIPIIRPGPLATCQKSDSESRSARTVTVVSPDQRS